MPIDLLTELASVYVRPLNWFLEGRVGLSGFRYRNMKSRVSARNKRQFEAVAGKWVDAYFELEARLRCPLKQDARFRRLDADTPPRELAKSVRRALGLSDRDPIMNMIELVEGFGVRVMEADAIIEIDGVAARHGSNFVVVLNRDTTADRLRMNAAHELAHVLYSDWKQDQGWSDGLVEKRAYEFASHLLLPDSALDDALKGYSFIRLIEFKKRFGISLAAMIYRAEKSKRIRTTVARRLWVNMSKRGWRKKEPGRVWRERAIRFEYLLDSAIQTKELTWREAESVTGITEAELKLRLLEAAGLPEEEEGDELSTLKLFATVD